MSIREKIEKHRGLTGAGVSVIIVAAIVFVCLNFRSAIAPKPYTTNTFYSSDDGASFVAGDGVDMFKNEFERTPPMLKVMVYGDGRENFVGYLMRHRPEHYKGFQEATRVADNYQKQPKQDFGKLRALLDAQASANKRLFDDYEIKKPRAGKWVPARSPEGLEILRNITSPSGSRKVDIVLP